MRGNGTWKLATIRGVDLQIHASLLLLLGYLIWVIGMRFQDVSSQSGIDPATLSGGPFIWGVILSIALFVSVTLHEFGHVWVAQKQGALVRSITLMMLGGVSAMEHLPERKYAEFRLAIVGPLVSLAISGLFYLAYLRTGSANLAFFSYWVASANLGLALFNLLPAFPLDGGRVLRSILAARNGIVMATQTSAKFSKYFAWALGLMGFVSFSIPLILIAFFIHSAAQHELFFILTRGLFKGIDVSEVTVETTALSDRTNLAQAVDEMIKTRHTVLPVLRNTGGMGLVYLAQIKRVPRNFWSVTMVQDVMEEAQKVLESRQPLVEALADLSRATGGVLPVRKGDRLVGFVRYSDVTELLKFKSLAEPAAPVESASVSHSDKHRAA